MGVLPTERLSLVRFRAAFRASVPISFDFEAAEKGRGSQGGLSTAAASFEVMSAENGGLGAMTSDAFEPF